MVLGVFSLLHGKFEAIDWKGLNDCPLNHARDCCGGEGGEKTKAK